MHFRDIKILLGLAVPLIFSGLMESSLSFSSTLFVAHLGENELAASALTSWLFATLLVILWGTLTSVSVLVSRKYGEGDHVAIAHILRDALSVSVLIVLPLFIVLWYLPKLFLLLGQPVELIALSTRYIHALAWSLLPDLVCMTLIQFIIGLGHTRTAMIINMLWLPLNVFLNYVLVFGKWGFPALGIAGIGWGTTISYWITMIGVIVYIALNKKYKAYIAPLFNFDSILLYAREICHLGLPMGSMFCIEVAFFLILTLFMGFLGKNELAANQIFLQFLGLFVSFSFSIAGAITIRMGHMLGAGDVAAAERGAYAGISISFVFTFLIALLYWLCPYLLIGLDFDVSIARNETIIELARGFLAIGAVFQLSESIRLTLYGALRALQDTRYPMLTSIISFWLVPAPFIYLFAVVLNWGGVGAWCGVTLGALVGMGMLYKRFRYKMEEVPALVH